MELRELRHFELRELYYFVAVAEELHFARAAERVGIHQSPLSKAISLMEHHLGVQLFLRDRRSTTLTPLGKSFLNDAPRILAEVDRARLGILAAAAGHTGHLRIAVTDGLTHTRLTALLRRTCAAEPRIDVQVTLQPLAGQLAGLRAGLLDVGMAVTAPDARALAAAECGCSAIPTLNGLGESIEAAPLWTETLSVVLEEGHPLAGSRWSTGTR